MYLAIHIPRKIFKSLTYPVPHIMNHELRFNRPICGNCSYKNRTVCRIQNPEKQIKSGTQIQFWHEIYVFLLIFAEDNNKKSQKTSKKTHFQNHPILYLSFCGLNACVNFHKKSEKLNVHKLILINLSFKGLCFYLYSLYCQHLHFITPDI